ncbi:MAG: response regulator [Dehalococcoidales bacterium]|nr:response regulator [Dehalococcoidales bacterium]
MTERQKSVLVVDDEPKVLKFIEVDLKLQGFKVTTLTSGREALEQVDSLNPDIILLDIVMPEVNGLEVLKQLRTYSELPVIAFSADSTNKYKALLNGANDFIVKPFDPTTVVKKINIILEY